MSEPFDAAERRAVVQRLQQAEAEAYPAYDPAHPVPPLKAARARDKYHFVVAEYADRLPRVLMSVCPFLGLPLRRVFDPFGLDGPWWHTVRPFEADEPQAPPTFRVLLGALDLRGRVPKEATGSVLAGPGAPFVVPRLLELPGMVAVLHRLELATGDLAYPVGYFSRQSILPEELHQGWTRQELWFKSEDGNSVWTMKNDVWDFELAPWIESGKLRWIEMDGGTPRVVGPEDGKPCPYAGLGGIRKRQIAAQGELGLGELPDGSDPDPFG